MELIEGLIWLDYTLEVHWMGSDNFLVLLLVKAHLLRRLLTSRLSLV